MKQLLFYLFIGTGLVALSCSASNNVSKGTRISGNVTGANGLKVYLDKARSNNNMMVLSQTDADAQGAFALRFEETLEPGVYRLRVGVKRALFIFDGTEKDVSIQGDLNTLEAFQHTVKGSSATEEFMRVMGEIAARRMGIPEIRSYLTQAQEPLVAMQIAQLVFQNSPDFLDVHRSVLINLERKYPYAEFTNEYKTQVAQIERTQQSQMARQPIQIGMPAPEISMQGPNGNTYNLSDLRGKVVLLDFWAAWCGPCRKANPHLVDVYHRYKDRGFTVFSVSLDGIDNRTKQRLGSEQAVQQNMENQRQRWIQAIQQDKLTWDYHVSDLLKWDTPAARQYGVTGIPRFYLIDREGNIAAINPRHNLEDELQRLL